MKLRIPLSVLVYVLASVGSAAQAAPSAEDVNQELQNYARDPQKFLNEIPVKRNGVTGRINRSNPMALSQSDIQDGKFLEIKAAGQDIIRSNTAHSHPGPQNLLRRNLNTFSAYRENDLAQNLVDELKYTTLEELENANLRTAKLEASPWSTSYWPTFRGGIADRYLHRAAGKNASWLAMYDAELGHLGSTKHATDLSPAEKYDLLVGDANWTLTKNQLELGHKLYDTHVDEHGKLDHFIELWRGICHGWGPASFVEKRPSHAVELLSPNGQKIKFYPDDIKALTTLLWANAPGKVKLIGGRCGAREKNLVEDQNGRVLDQNCFDTNPGTWHLAVTNQIGVAKRGMVLDATYDYEVWNQPIVGYSYSYFNPISNSAASDLASASVKLSDFSTDKFAKYRAVNAVSVVGVAMDLEYVVEVEPDHAEEDGPEQDQTLKVRYMYDLELDAQGRIVGGEWYKNLHPDFIWTVEKGAQAISVGDPLIDHGGLTQAAQIASQLGQPLNKIVKMLIDKANTEVE